MADSIYPFLPPLPPGVAPGDVEYQTYGRVDGVAWTAGWLPSGAANVGEWWIGFSTAVTSYTATMENVAFGVYPTQFATTFPYASNVSAGPLSISVVNALTVQLAQTVSGTSTLAIMNPYGPLAPLTFNSLTDSLGADAPEAPTALLIGLGLLAFALVRRLTRNNRPVIDYVLRRSRSCDVTRCLNGRLILPFSR